MESTDFEALPARILNYTTRLMLGKYINPKAKVPSNCNYAPDYRGLAEQMQFSLDDIKRFCCSEDPTMKILEEWATQQDATVGKLITFLNNMGRHDVIADLRPRFEEDAKLHLRSKEEHRENPLQDPEESTYDYDVFISYADEDIKFACSVVEYLESNGFKVFVRSKDLLAEPVGDVKNVHFLQEKCKRILMILSPDFIKSPVCEVLSRFAASLGYRERCRKIIPILLKPCVIPTAFRFLSKFDFTKPGVQDWIWEALRSSLHPEEMGVYLPSKNWKN